MHYEVVRDRLPTLGVLSRSPAYAALFTARSVSLVGDGVGNLALIIHVQRDRGTGTAVALLLLVASLPRLVSPLAGVVADRVNKRRAVILTQSLQMLHAFALAALVWSGAATVTRVMALAAALGVIAAFDIPLRQSFIVNLVGKEDLMNAIALNSSVFNATRVVGPVLAGLLIGPFGVAFCFFVNGVSYLAVIAGLLAMRTPRPPLPAPRSSAWHGFLEVIGFIRTSRLVRTLIALTAVLSIFGFQVVTLMPVFARDVLGAGAPGYGLLMASLGIGAMLGALGIAVASGRIPKGRTMLAGGTAFGLLVTLFAWSRSLALSLLLGALAGCAMIVNNALTGSC